MYESFTKNERKIADNKLSKGNFTNAYGLTQRELWGLMRDEYNHYRRVCHHDDDCTFSDFVSEHAGTMFWGARVVQEITGDCYFQLPNADGTFTQKY